jgi:hypothetical protein
MNKSILLGLGLISFFGHAMETEKYGKIHKAENAEYVVYTALLQGSSDTIRAYYKKNDDGTWVYDASRQDRIGFSMDCCSPQKVFENLKEEYARQKSSQ